MAEGRGRAATNPVQMKAWLYKWTNYIKGYQRRWFVLSNGLLSYYRTQEEMAHTCRGTVNLAGAFIDPVDVTHFVVSNGKSQVYHLRAINEKEKQCWMTALSLAKAKAIKSMESDSCSDSEDESRGGGSGSNDDPLTGLQDKLKELSVAHDIVVKNGHGLTKMIGELEESGGRGVGGKLSEQLALFKPTALGMIKASDEFMVQARSTERRWSRALQHEETSRLTLQENMETLAEQLTKMEEQARQRFQGSSRNRSQQGSAGSEPLSLAELELEDDQFFDAPEMSDSDLARTGSAPATPTLAMPTLAGLKGSLDSRSVNEAHGLITPTSDRLHPVSTDTRIAVPDKPAPSFLVDVRPTIAHRRTAVPPKPSSGLSLWSIVKNCIGKDISKIPMPVNFSEPLSLLQRITEEMQYTEVLDMAVNAQDTLEEMAYVGAFVTSPYAATVGRANKPFNPMLGETYECDRRAELGWRCLFEQVSHHPPMFAEYTEGRHWTFWQEYTAAYNFRGKYVTILPLGTCHLVFHKTKSHYTWCKCVTTVHNIIVGKLWIDQSGDIKFINHTTREEGLVKFHAYSYFSREQQRKVTGHMKDVDGKVHYVIKGYWDQQYDVAKVTGGEGRHLETGPYQTLWRARQPEPGHEIMYGFSHFAAGLNEHEPGVAPTDSRFRPDQRIMEEGDFPRANAKKVHLEEKQRARRRKREAVAEKAAAAAARGDVEEAERLKEEATFKPVWFNKEYDPLTNTMMHAYKGGYWEAKQAGDWDKLNLPDIF